MSVLDKTTDAEIEALRGVKGAAENLLESCADNSIRRTWDKMRALEEAVEKSDRAAAVAAREVENLKASERAADAEIERLRSRPPNIYTECTVDDMERLTGEIAGRVGVQCVLRWLADWMCRQKAEPAETEAAAEPGRPEPKFQVGQVVDWRGSIRRIQSVVPLSDGYEGRAYEYRLEGGHLLVPESQLRPHAMTLDDVPEATLH